MVPKLFLKRFRINFLKTNPKKLQFESLITLNMNATTIRECSTIGITINITLTFSEHISNLCHSASFKLTHYSPLLLFYNPWKVTPGYNGLVAVGRIRKYLDMEKVLCASYIRSHFNCESTIWMLYTKRKILRSTIGYLKVHSKIWDNFRHLKAL